MSVRLGRVGTTAVFNVVRMGSGFVLVALLPFLVRRLEADEYNVWTLTTSAPAYINLLGSGVAVAVVRLVSTADSTSEAMSAVTAGSRFSGRLGLLGAIGACVVAAAVPLLFPAIPDDLVWATRFGIATVGLGAAVGLLSIPYQSYFNAIHRNGPSAVLSLSLRVLGGVAVVATVGAGLGVIQAVLALSLASAAFGQRWLYRRSIGESVGVPPTSATRAEFVSVTSTLGLWSVVSLMSNGVDIAVVGALDFDQVGAYGAAASIAAILSAVHTAAMNAFLPDAARTAQVDGGRSTILAASRIGASLSFLALGAVLAVGVPVMDLLFGDLGADAFPILLVLVAARTVGSLIWPYVLVVLAAGEHHRIRVTPVIEGVVNLGLSLALVATIGAIGAAIGTLAASTLAMAMHLMINRHRTTSVRFDVRAWFRASLGLPLVVSAPLIVAWVVGVAIPSAAFGVGCVGVVTSAGLFVVAFGRADARRRLIGQGGAESLPQ